MLQFIQRLQKPKRFPRATRRRFKKNADAMALGIVRGGIYETLRDGSVLRITEAKALEAAEFAVRECLKGEGETIMVRLPEEAGAAFPGSAQRAPGTRHMWLLIEPDEDQRVSFQSLWVASGHPLKVEARLAAERMEAGRAENAKGGFPARLPGPRLLQSAT